MSASNPITLPGPDNWYETGQAVTVTGANGDKYIDKRITEIVYTTPDGNLATGYKCSKCDYANTNPGSVKSHARAHSKRAELNSEVTVLRKENVALKAQVKELAELNAVYDAALAKLPDPLRLKLLSEDAPKEYATAQDPVPEPTVPAQTPHAAAPATTPIQQRATTKQRQQATYDLIKERFGDGSEFTVDSLLGRSGPTVFDEERLVTLQALPKLLQKGLIERTRVSVYRIVK